MSGTAERVVCYVDGFNLYFGLRESGFERFYWLNMQKMGEGFLKGNQELTHTKYFTARVSGSRPGDDQTTSQKRTVKRARQTCFLEALATLERFSIFEGHYLENTESCRKCKSTWIAPKEKMTDVCIATELLMDAYLDRFDVAIVVSGDSDLVPPIKAIRKHFDSKKVVVAFPPKRTSAMLPTVASAYFSIGKSVLRDSQFPDPVIRQDGFALIRPATWA